TSVELGHRGGRVALYFLPGRPGHPRRHRHAGQFGSRLGLAVGPLVHADADGLHSHVNNVINITLRTRSIDRPESEASPLAGTREHTAPVMRRASGIDRLGR